MKNNGYFQYPIYKNNSIYFISEENLWQYDFNIERSIKLTSTKGEIKNPVISSNGELIVFSGNEEGDEELFLLNLKNGQIYRLTYLGSNIFPIMFFDNDNKILFTSNYNNPFNEIFFLYSIDIESGEIIKINVGCARFVSFKNNNFDLNNIILQPYTEDMTQWKRYRGGSAGKLWIKKDGSKKFKLLKFEKGNISNPIFYEEFIIFISDFEGIGNLYKSDLDLKKIKKLTNHSDFYVRNPSLNYDEKIIVYQCGGNIYKFDLLTEKYDLVNINYFSSKPQKRGKYIDIENYIQGYTVSNDGKKIALNIRGKIAGMYNWYGPVDIITNKNNIRDSLPVFLSDNETICFVTDELNDVRLAISKILSSELKTKRKIFKQWDFGNIIEIESSKIKNYICISNHRNELYFIDIENETYKFIDKSSYGVIDSFSFSFDSNYIAYSFPISFNKSIIKIYDIQNDRRYEITDGLGFDFAPYFSPDGKYLLFISGRNFDPVDDYLQFEISFPFGLKPYIILLDKTLSDPFAFSLNDFEENESELNAIDLFDEMKIKKSSKTKEKIIFEFVDNLNKKEKLNEKEQRRIDFDNIKRRILEFPVVGGIYTKIEANYEKFFFLLFPLKGEFESNLKNSDFGYLYTYNLKTKEIEIFYEGVVDFKLIDNGKKLFLLTSEYDFRIIDSSEKPTDNYSFNPKDGYIDIKRIKIYVEPEGEWEQMFKEAWRLQRDYFWNENFIKEDWIEVFNKYYKILPKVSTRTELSDLIKEMQGELGTSHCYEYGGDKRKAPFYNIGFLGIDVEFDKKLNFFKILKIYPGDPWIEVNRSPFLTPGINVKEGDYIISIDGNKVDLKNPINKLLKNKPNDFVDIVIGRTIELKKDTKKIRNNNEKNDILIFKNKMIKTFHIYIKTVPSEKYLRYRHWVDNNRDYVHKKSGGKIGYIHIPDMEYFGYSEFHKYFLKEINYIGLIIDIRYNKGGFVSELIVEKLSRKIIGYDFTRWVSKPETYPKESPKGPMIFLANEYTGSDGDIFVYAVKFMKLGKILGTRTWGGIIGVSYKGGMIDGAYTTQPEYIFWFKDIGAKIENFGVEPDYEVELIPEDWQKGRDSQLDKAIHYLLKKIKKINHKDIKNVNFNNIPRI
ncbi:MAG: S41 family peptidase [Spirochaetes bacterium]|nr:S41 family peptidase [Spirochaetota bacterium]